MLSDPVGRLGRRNEEEHVGALQRGAQPLPVGVAAGGLVHLGAVELRRTDGVAHDEALAGAALGQPAGDARADGAGGPGHGDEWIHAASVMAGGAGRFEPGAA